MFVGFFLDMMTDRHELIYKMTTSIYFEMCQRWLSLWMTDYLWDTCSKIHGSPSFTLKEGQTDADYEVESGERGEDKVREGDESPAVVIIEIIGRGS